AASARGTTAASTTSVGASAATAGSRPLHRPSRPRPDAGEGEDEDSQGALRDRHSEAQAGLGSQAEPRSRPEPAAGPEARERRARQPNRRQIAHGQRTFYSRAHRGTVEMAVSISRGGSGA